MYKDEEYEYGMCIIIDSTLLVVACGLLSSLVAVLAVYLPLFIAPSVVLEAWLQGYHLLPPV